MKHIKMIIVVFTLSLVGLVMIPPAVSNALPAHIVAADLKSDANQGLDQVGGGGTSVESVVSAVVQVLSVIIGIAGVIMIIVSGLKYITSGGDAAKVGSAKTTLIYALIGLAIATLAQVLVHFVINTAQESRPCPSNHSISISDKACH